MDRDITPDLRSSGGPLGREKVDRPDREAPHDIRERYAITPREAQTLVEIGRFRTVALDDLRSHRYDRSSELRADLRSLLALGLIQKRTALVARGRQKLAVLVLTKAGKRLAETHRSNPEQALYAGFVKPGEIAHDAAIYRMFHKEAARIEKDGGTVRRVVLDYELKRKIYSPLAKSRSLSPLEYAKRQAEVAREVGLKVVNGKIPLPDLRIEYETAQGEMARVDLELATHHYHGSHLREKVAAGFKLYGDSAATRRTPVFEEREITASILSL